MGIAHQMAKPFNISILLVLLIAASAACFLYLNYCPDAMMGEEFASKTSDLTDIKISKFIVESLKKVVVTIY